MSVADTKTRTWVKPYQRDGVPVTGYFREPGRGHFDLARKDFVDLLDSLPVGTRFTLAPADRNAGYWSLRGTWEKVDYGGLPYWFNRDRALHRTSGDFHTYAAHHVLVALDAAGALRARDAPGKTRKPQEFLAEAQTLVDRGILPSTHGVKPTILVQREIDRTMNLISGVHGIVLDTETPPKVVVLAFDGKDGLDGTYKYDDTGGVATPSYLRIARMPAAPEVSLTHEFAHYIDQQILGRRLNFGSRQALGLDGFADKDSHPLGDVMHAIAESAAMKKMQALRDSTDTVQVRGPLGESLSYNYQDAPVKKMTDYYLLPEEAFARAYTQYIATRSDDPRMRETLSRRVDGMHPQQWADADFASVADAFDALFDRLGWRQSKTKAAIRVRPYLREGHPVAGYAREIPWRAVMPPDLADQWAADSAIRDPLYHATTGASAASIRSEGFRLSKGFLFGKVWGDGVYLSPDAGAAEFWRSKLERGDVLETRVRVRKVLQIDITDDHPVEGLTSGLKAMFEKLGPNVLKQRNDLYHKLLGEKYALEEEAQRQFPNPYSFRDIHEPSSDITRPVKRPGAEAMVAANHDAGEKRQEWLLAHGWVEDPKGEATRRILIEHGYDALEIIDNTGVTQMRVSGGPQILVFDPQNVVVVNRKLSTRRHQETVLAKLAALAGNGDTIRLTYSDGTTAHGKVSVGPAGQILVGNDMPAAEDVTRIERQTVGETKWRHVWTYGEAHKAVTHVAPYIREGRPVSGYDREFTLGFAESATDLLGLPKTGKLRELVKPAIASLDRLLRLPHLPKLPVKATAGKDARGGYKRTGTMEGDIKIWRPVQIRISARVHDTDSPALTLTHEVAHYLDNQGFRPTGVDPANADGSWWESIAAHEWDKMVSAMEEAGVQENIVAERKPLLGEWYRAVKRTASYQTLTSANMMEYGTHVYLLNPKELWARSFAQWVAIRSGNPEMLKALRAWQRLPMERTEYRENWKGDKVPTVVSTPRHMRFRQWQDEDFAPVAAEIDKIMEKAGWLR